MVIITKIDTKQKETIQQILTLRYSKNWDNLHPTITPNYFQVDNLETNHEEFIENSIRTSIREQVESDQKNVGVALSSGIDSTLVLALLRKEFLDDKATMFLSRIVEHGTTLVLNFFPIYFRTK